MLITYVGHVECGWDTVWGGAGDEYTVWSVAEGNVMLDWPVANGIGERDRRWDSKHCIRCSFFETMTAQQTAKSQELYVCRYIYDGLNRMIRRLGGGTGNEWR